jgi:hypothetical protein
VHEDAKEEIKELESAFETEELQQDVRKRK